MPKLTAFKKGRLVRRTNKSSDKVYRIDNINPRALGASCQLGRADHLHPNGAQRSLWGWTRVSDLELVQPEEGGIK